MNILLIKLITYRLEPDTTLATKRIEGGKKDKERLTTVLCRNADGSDKLSLFVIGKFLKLRCLKNVNMNNLGVIYRANARAWMAAVLFQE